jgi:hypothetical protein
VHADRQEITHRFDAMTVTRDGRLLVAWIDKRDLPAGGKAADYAGRQSTTRLGRPRCDVSRRL